MVADNAVSALYWLVEEGGAGAKGAAEAAGALGLARTALATHADDGEFCWLQSSARDLEETVGMTWM